MPTSSRRARGTNIKHKSTRVRLLLLSVFFSVCQYQARPGRALGKRERERAVWCGEVCRDTGPDYGDWLVVIKHPSVWNWNFTERFRLTIKAIIIPLYTVQKSININIRVLQIITFHYVAWNWIRVTSIYLFTFHFGMPLRHLLLIRNTFEAGTMQCYCLDQTATAEESHFWTGLE